MTRIVSILESNGYVTSVIESEGRQVKKLYITERGKLICDGMLPVILSVWETIVEGLTEEEVDFFLKTLDKLEENMRNKIVLQI